VKNSEVKIKDLNGVPLSIRTRKTVPQIGIGKCNAEKTKDQLFVNFEERSQKCKICPFLTSKWPYEVL
jgi:hypothetical protein